MDNFVKTSSLFAITTPSLNSTAEFSLTTDTVSSEQGRGGAQVNLVTKGGTNDFHGFLPVNESLTPILPLTSTACPDSGAGSLAHEEQLYAELRPVLREKFYGGDVAVRSPEIRLNPIQEFGLRTKFSFRRNRCNPASRRKCPILALSRLVIPPEH